MNNKQVLVYGLLESTNYLRSIFGTHPFQKTYEISKMYWNISLLLDQAQEQEIRFLLIIFIDKTTLRKENMGQRNLMKHFKFRDFSEIFYCGMTRLKNTNFECFYTMSINKNHFKKQKIWDSVCLGNIQNFKILMKYFTVAWPGSGTRIGVFSYNFNKQKPF